MVKVSLSKKKGLVRGAGKPVLRGSFDCGMAPRRKRNAAVGRTDGPGAEDASDPNVEKAQALLREVWEGDLPALIPVLEVYAKTMTFDRFAEIYSSIVSMIDSAGDVTNCDVSGPGCYIDNYGSKADRFEAFLNLLPIVQRIMDRPDAEDEKVDAGAPAAVKGEKQ